MRTQSKPEFVTAELAAERHWTFHYASLNLPLFRKLANSNSIAVSWATMLSLLIGGQGVDFANDQPCPVLNSGLD